jgi:hypothetical protein
VKGCKLSRDQADPHLLQGYRGFLPLTSVGG